MLNESLLEANSGNFEEFKYELLFKVALFDIWAPPEKPIVQKEELQKEKIPASDASRVLFSRSRSTVPDHLLKPTIWSIAFTPTFKNSIAKIDKNLQGRILVVLSELSENPISLIGDTKKPLIGNLKGLWRYRLGDFRLIYLPNIEANKVVLLEFAARGSSYD